MGERVRRFAAARAQAGLDGGVLDDQALEQALEGAVAEARAAYPSLRWSDDELVAHLGRHARGADPQSVRAVRVGELFVAGACAAGHDEAIAHLERDFMGAAAAGLAQMGLTDGRRDEALQVLRHKLLRPTEGEPGIASYSGAGSLAGWLRTAVTRIALNQRRTDQRRQAREEGWFADQLLPAGDPELDYLQERYRSELQDALTAAFERLQDDQRRLLRRYVIDGETLETLASEHGVALSTVSRWLSRIRDKLAADARRHFAQACSLDPSECDSLVRLVKSDLHVSVLRLLDE